MSTRTRPQTNEENVHAPLASSTRPHVVREITEARMNEAIKSLGLSEWIVIWEPDLTQPSRGQVLLESKTIIINDEEPEDAFKTLLHEALEIKLRPMLRPYRTLVNALIEWADGQVYESKEKVIEDLLPFLLKSIEEGHPSERSHEGV